MEVKGVATLADIPPRTTLSGSFPRAEAFGELFSQDGFDAHHFVSKYLSAASATFQPTSLESLRVELKAYGERLKAQLVDLLNREYADFIGLASGLVGTRESIQSITQQLSDVRQRLQVIQQNVQQALAAVEGKLDARRKLNEQRACLETLAEVHQSVRSVKATLAMCKQLPRGALQSSLSTSASGEQLGGPAAGDGGQPAGRQDDLAFAMFQQLMSEPLEDLSATAGSSTTVASSLLSSSSPSLSAGAALDDALSHNAVLLERLARQLSSLRILMAQTVQFELVRQQGEPVAQLEAEFEQRLCDAFVAAVARGAAASDAAASSSSSSSSSALPQLLRAFAFADKTALAESIVRERVVRPIVQQHVTKERLLAAAPPPAAAETKLTGAAAAAAARAGSAAAASAPAAGPQQLPLAAMYASLLASVRAQCSALLSASSAAAGAGGADSAFSFDFLGGSVWSEVADALAALGPTLLNTGIPDAFHSNYSLSMRLLRDFEQLCDGDAGAVERFRSHPATAAFRARWNLPVYFSLRFQRIAAALEAAVARPPAVAADAKEAAAAAAAGAGSGAEVKAAGDAAALDRLLDGSKPAPPQFALEQTRALWDCLELCWSPTVWLEDLTHRFFKLTLQLLARYCAWLEQGVAAPGASAPAPAAASPASASDATAVTAAAAGGGAWADVPVETLVLVYADVQALLSRLPGDVVAAVMARLQPVAATATAALQQRDAVAAGVAAGAARLKALTPALGDRVAGDIGRRCCDMLAAAVPRIRTQYRLTGLAPPTAASAYVADVLAALRVALPPLPRVGSGTRAGPLRDSDRRALSAAVCTSVAERFAALATDMVDVFRRTESSLRRFAKSKAATAGAGGAAAGAGAGGGAAGSDVSDLFKIQKQLLLDAGELLRILGDKQGKDGLGLSAAECAGVGVLAKFVQGIEKQLASGED